MTPEAELELIKTVAAIEEATKIYAQQNADAFVRLSAEISRLASIAEDRERQQRIREEITAAHLHNLDEWNLKHPTDPTAHKDLHDLAALMAQQQEETREIVSSNTARVAAVEQTMADRRKERETERRIADENDKKRSKLWGFGHGTLIVISLGLGSVGSLIAITEALK